MRVLLCQGVHMRGFELFSFLVNPRSFCDGASHMRDQHMRDQAIPQCHCHCQTNSAFRLCANALSTIPFLLMRMFTHSLSTAFLTPHRARCSCSPTARSSRWRCRPAGSTSRASTPLARCGYSALISRRTCRRQANVVHIVQRTHYGRGVGYGQLENINTVSKVEVA